MSVAVFYPPIPQSSIENLITDLASKQDSALSIGTGTSLALDFTTNKLQEQSISTNQTMTITGLAVGETGVAVVSNTHATTAANVTLPDADSDPSPAVIPALTKVKFTITRLSSSYLIEYGGALS